MKFLFLPSCLLFLFSSSISSAQQGSIISATQSTIGIGSAWQSSYASGFGIASQAQLSFFDFFAKDNQRTGFRVRDVWGGHVSLGVLLQPDTPMISVGPAAKRAPVWYDVGFDAFGLQFMYGFSDQVWLSFKGQMTFSFNSAAYYEAPFPTSYSSFILVAGAQAGPFGLELGKGWEARNKAPNYFTLGASIKLREKNATVNFLGVRFTQHNFREPSRYIDGEYQNYQQKNYFFSVFYAVSI